MWLTSCFYFRVLLKRGGGGGEGKRMLHEGEELKDYSRSDITTHALTITSAPLKETFQYFQTPSLQSQ